MRPPSPGSLTATIYNRDCFEAIRRLDSNSVDAVITDPPYFLDKLGDGWNVAALDGHTQGQVIKSLPGGMKFDPQQGKDFQSFMERVSRECYRVLKPGGALMAFSSPRLYHRLAVGVENAGFEIRDQFLWIYTQNQMKAMSLARFLEDKDLPPEVAADLRVQLERWKTPQVKSCAEPIVFAQKPKTDAAGNPVTFLDNWHVWGVGLINTQARVGQPDTMLPANVVTTEMWEDPENADAYDRAFLVGKPGKRERGTTKHISVKPLTLMDHLIRLVVQPGGLVLDPFSGSGSTGISALRVGTNYVGAELSEEYWRQSRTRFTAEFGSRLRWHVGGCTATARLSPVSVDEDAA